MWLRDMFGVSAQGILVSKLLFRRINPDRKRPVPVVIFIPPSVVTVSIEVDGRRVTTLEELQSCVHALERTTRVLTLLSDNDG
jgi:hypothetical protein